MQIHVPPLRKRKDDIPFLVHYFQSKYCFDYQRKLIEIPAKVLRFFVAYSWPGNIRELENVIRRGIALLDWDFVFEEMNKEDINIAEAPESGIYTDSSIPDIDVDELISLLEENNFSLKKVSKTYVDRAERRAIVNALQVTKWNRKKAAGLLGISYKTIINRIDEFDLHP